MTAAPPLLPTLHRSTADLLRGLDAEGWSDADIAAPSLCDGWTRGHVLTHIARNADGIARTLEGALRGEILERYPDGWDARNRDIDDGAKRPAAEILRDVVGSAHRLDRALADIDDIDGWDRPTSGKGPASGWVARRLTEVEIHRVDLRGHYTAADWPAELVVEVLPACIEKLPDRTAGPLRIEIDAAGSTAAGLAGEVYTAGDGDGPTLVRGPDWAVLAWLAGRSAAAQDRLTTTPELGPWR
jgi:maleylpyruvate isomerase